MKKNVGKLDRIIRLVLGVSIITVGFVNQTWLGLIGVGIIIPAIMASDPLYTILGLDTNK